MLLKFIGKYAMKGILADSPRFILIHFFYRRNPLLSYINTPTKRMFDASAHFFRVHQNQFYTEGRMRLDKYLKVSRIIKCRTVANSACDTEHVKVNGRDAKASYQVKVGDIIEIAFGERIVKIRVTDIKEHTLKNEAGELYEVL